MIKGSFKDRVGEVHTTKEGYVVEIISCTHNSCCAIRFLYNDFIKYNVDFADIKRGEIKNPYHASVFSIGYIGEGEYKTKENYKMTGCYRKWMGILKRAYGSTKYYEYVTVDERWHNFQNFAKWYEENWKPEYMDKTWHLDKDILIKGNKVYSPDTCCFVPVEINSLFTRTNSKRGKYPIGVCMNKSNGRFLATLKAKKFSKSYNTPEEAFQAYKIEKEKYITEVADKWKPLIKQDIYEVMYNYKVKIDD